jgi:hypothetical protein
MWRLDTETGQAYALQLTATGAKAIGLNAKPENAHSEKDVRRTWNLPGEPQLASQLPRVSYDRPGRRAGR